MHRNHDGMFIFLLAFSTVFITSKADKQLCSNHIGPPGNTVCVKFHDYEHYQWSTCLSNSYIQTKSAGKHICLYQYSSYCLYQCQLELFNQESGTVEKTCRCTPGEKAANATTSPLPSWCYSPSGDSCHWYKDCLEKRFQCSGTNYGYAIDFGTKFCQEYDKSYQSFTSRGKKWVNAVRKCLQVSLVPYLRDFNANSTCKQIRNSAINSHECCYNAGSLCTPAGTLSICNIPCMDWLRAAWTTKGAFVDEFTEPVSGIWQSVRACPKTSPTFRCLSNLAMYLRYFKMTLKIQGSWNQEILGINEEKIALDFMKSLLNQLNFNQNEIDWFFYASKDVKNAEVTTTTLNVNSVFMDSNLKYKTREHHITFSEPLQKLVEEIMGKINNGSLRFDKESDESIKISLEEVSQCEGIMCEKVISTAIIPESTTTSKPQSNTDSPTSTKSPTTSTPETESNTDSTPPTGSKSKIDRTNYASKVSPAFRSCILAVVIVLML